MLAQLRLRTLVSRLLVFLLALSAQAAGAQTFRGGINGSITDTTGAAVSGAGITATNTGTGVKITGLSSSNGNYLFDDLPLGDYSITVSATGFAITKVDNVNVSAGVLYTLPVKLTVSTATETVEVSAASIALDTTTVTQTTVLTAKEVDNLPLNGRDFTQMIQLTPGYAGYSGSGFGSLNGTRSNQMNWQIDGVDNNDLWHNIPAVNQGGVSGIAGIILPIDAIDEFSAQTQAGPEGGRNPGGTINLTLKSGTNQLHGTAYYFNRNEAFGAKSPFSDTKQKIRNYNTGFSVGGPFIKDRLFGFLTFEHQRFVIGESGSTTEPSVGWQSQAKAVLARYNIPSSALMQNVLNTLWARGNLAADTAGGVDNFHSTDPEFGYSWDGLGKVDWHITDKDNLSVHWFVGQGNQVAPVGSQLLDFYEVAPIHVQNIAILYNRQLSPHMSNQILAGVNYFNQVFDDYNTHFNVQSLGFVTGAGFSNAPNIKIRGYDKVGLTPPEGRNDITGHLTDQLSWVKGAHQMRFGGEYRQAQLDEFYHRRATGSFTFDGTRTGALAAAATGSTTAPVIVADGHDTYRYALADYLAGYTSAASIQIGEPERQVFVNTFFVNAGDSWQATRKFNIDYGVRYDYTGPLHNGTQDLSVFRPALTATNGLALQGVQIPNLFQQYWKSISPRVGMNYQLGTTTVLRASYGWYFDSPNLNPFLDNRPGNSAPNGVESNPIGPSPVSGIVATGVVQNGAQLPSGKTNITAGQNIFGGVNSVCNGVSGTIQCGIFSVDPAFRPSYNENYSFNLEQTLSPNVILQLGYVGSEGRHLLSLLDINQGTTQATRPFYRLYPNYTNINQIESIGTSNYNSLQSTLRLQNFHRLSAQLAYTWSHNLDEVTSYRGSLPQNSYDFKGDYSNSDFDTRNSVVAFLTYQIPGTAGHFRGLTNGWVVNSLMSFHGGQPFTVFASGDVSGTGEGFDRAVQIGDPGRGYLGQKPGVNWLDPAAFTNPAPGTFGTTRRNGYYGPGYSDVDLSVFKDTKFGERLTVQLRAEMFNLFNRVNYAPPGGGGVAVGGDFTLNDTLGDYNGAPGIGAGEPFNMQLGGKIIF